MPPDARVPHDRDPRELEKVGDRDLTHWRTRAGARLVDVVDRGASALTRGARWSRANVALVLTVVVGGLVVLLVDLLAASVYDAVTEREGLESLDRPVLDAAVRLRTPGLDSAVTAFTDLGSVAGMTTIVVVLAGLLAVLRRSRTPVVLLAVAAAGSVGMTLLGKNLVGRARPPATLAVPPLETTPSFPSGHTLNATVLIGVAAYLLVLGIRRGWLRGLVVVLATLFVVAMGLSRVFLGHHWLTDVVAGWLLGLGWLATVVTGHRVQLTLRRRGQPPASAARPASSRATGTRNGEHDT